jgi:hypothetical protein
MSISHKLRHVIAALALFVGTPTIPASADVIGITSIAELGPNADSFSWRSLGPAFTVLIGDQTVVSRGLKATVASPPADFSDGPATVAPPSVLQRLDQNNGWNGNFAPGTPLLWNVDAGFGVTQQAAISVTFSAPVRGAGVQTLCSAVLTVRKPTRWVIRDQSTRRPPSRHVHFAPKADIG